MFVTAIIAAGGRGQRFGGGRPKQLHAARRPRGARAERGGVTAIHPAIDEARWWRCPGRPGLADPPPYLRRDADAGKPLRLVAGGVRRQDSVANAFRRRSAIEAEIVVIHDAARVAVSLSADLIESNEWRRRLECGAADCGRCRRATR